MNPETTTELIWHFAGYLHLGQEYSISRVKYEEVSYNIRIADHHYGSSYEASLPSSQTELVILDIRVTYHPKYDRLDHVRWRGDQSDHLSVDAQLTPHPPEPQRLAIEAPIAAEAGALDIETVFATRTGAQYRAEEQGDARQDDDGTPAGRRETVDREPTYEMNYVGGGNDMVATVVQQNLATDVDFVLDASEEYAERGQRSAGAEIPEALDQVRDLAPDLLQPLGQATEFWTTTVLSHHGALASGEKEVRDLAPGRFVNGERQEQDASASRDFSFKAPAPPEWQADDAGPIQIAELGANKAQNAALIGDFNEAPSTLIVGGDYYETNAIIQANIFQGRDHILNAGPSPISLSSEGSSADNIADFVAHDIAKHGAFSGGKGNLKVNVEVADGDFIDVKTLTQRNFLQDGDVSIQARSESYSKVATGANEQYNAAKFMDWGKQYDMIIVVGDYHSANIVSQANVVLDNDVGEFGSGYGPSWLSGYGWPFGYGNGQGDSSLDLTGQNALRNEAAITRYGATTYSDMTDGAQNLVGALGRGEMLGRDAWSGFHGSASGSFDVLFVTGNYYDINVISQFNMITDMDYALQMNPGMAGYGMQWLSWGGNMAFNRAEIFNAGGIYKQYVGGKVYEDSILAQANLLSEGLHVTNTGPAALVPELIAFMDPAQGVSASDGETWTSTIYSNHDSFGHILS